jgi:MoaA/NifB/PqqE/SkfB family radical SAM enzyme
MRNPLGRLLLSIALRWAGGVRGDGEKVLGFLASHRGIQGLLTAAVKSRLCRRLVRCACREAVARYGDVDAEEAFRLITNFKNFAEGTEINAFSEIYQKSSGTRWMDWISKTVADLDDDAKATLLTRVVYSVFLKGLNRRIYDIRSEGDRDRIPNLSTLFLATSSKCNLDCRDCESAFERGDGAASFEDLDYIIRQAKTLNTLHIAIIGKGEPLLDESHKRTLHRLVRKHWDLNFFVFTNGTTITEQDVAEMARLDNLFLIVSLDGLKQTNDERRGRGVFDRVCTAMRVMRDHALFFAFSSTVFRGNRHEILSKEFLQRMSDMGCKAGFYLQYLPLSGLSAEEMLLREADVREYEDLYRKAREDTPIPIIDPVIFERAHGCRARRGSAIYIDGTTGMVTPCVKTPFAPAECNILTDRHNSRLREILGTAFYVDYRNGYNECGCCSTGLERELREYLSGGSMPQRDSKKAKRYLTHISR